MQKQNQVWGPISELCVPPMQQKQQNETKMFEFHISDVGIPYFRYSDKTCHYFKNKSVMGAYKWLITAFNATKKKRKQTVRIPHFRYTMSLVQQNKICDGCL